MDRESPALARCVGAAELGMRVQVRLGYVPNFDELHANFQEELLARKQAAQVTTPKPFKLHNERVGDVAAKVCALHLHPPCLRWV